LEEGKRCMIMGGGGEATCDAHRDW
jgi:hypothetical protein